MKRVHEDSMLLKENINFSKRAYGSCARRILMKSETATVAIRKWSPRVDRNLHLRIVRVAVGSRRLVATVSIRKWRFQSTRGDHLRIVRVAVGSRRQVATVSIRKRRFQST